MPYFGSLIVLGQQATQYVWHLKNKLTGTRVPSRDVQGVGVQESTPAGVGVFQQESEQE